MLIEKKQKLIFILLITIIYLVGFILQTTILLNGDVSWAMHIATRMLMGGTYSTDFFEHNPPMLFYLHIPYVFVAQWFSAPIILSLRIYFFLLASLSFYACYECVRRIFSQRETLLGLSFLVTLLFLFLIFLPTIFAQKEHLLFILAMPYLLVVTTRLQGYRVPVYFAAIVGAMAGIGFAFKPFFLVTFMMIELYYIFSKKNLFAWLRTENIVIIFMMLCYVLVIITFYQDYLHVVVPMAMRLYYSGLGHPFYTFLFKPLVLYCYLAILFYILSYKNNPHRIISSILFIAMIGFLFAYFMQSTGYDYQLLPALYLAMLLSALLFFIFAFQTEVKISDYIIMIAVGLAILIYLNSYYRASWHTTLLLFACFAIFPMTRRSIIACLNTAAFGAIIFTFLIFITGNAYSSAGAEKKQVNKLITYMNAHVKKHQAIYVFSLVVQHTFPLVDYAGIIPATRSIMLWQIPGLLKQPGNVKDRDLFINMIAEDLAKKQPSLVFVDLLSSKGVLKPICFNYLLFFAQNQQFVAQWKHYKYFTTLDLQPSYKLAVYKRVD